MKLDIGRTLQAIAKRHPDTIMDTADGYGEPGYSAYNTTKVVLGDYWIGRDDNDRLLALADRYPNIMRRLEEMGVQFEWADEWTIVHGFDLGKGLSVAAFRTSADSHMWQPSVLMHEDGEYLHPQSDPQEWIDWAINDPQRCIPSVVGVDLSDSGFVRYGEREQAGLHVGMDANPRDLLSEIRKLDPDADVVFSLDETSQFYVEFTAWVRHDEDYEG